jgi:homoserine kinase
MCATEMRRAAVRSPATSANLGPGFDAFGLCLGLYDDLAATTTPSGLSVQVGGVGAETLPSDETHLVVHSLRAALDVMGVEQTGLSLVTENRIPHGRGLGSSAAAIVGGITLAQGLYPEFPLGPDEALRLASDLEGHPDNVAACLFGGFTIAWTESDGAHSTRLDVSSKVRVQVLVPEYEFSTEVARAALPDEVPHRDAAANAGRAGLLVAALTHDPSLLLAGTADWLHQAYREPAMPESHELLGRLRAEGLAATVSGAGPSILVLSAEPAPRLNALVPEGWTCAAVAVEPVGASVVQPVRPG